MTNWSAMAKGRNDWYLASSLIALGNEINRAWPRRDTASDGAIGDASHQARKSDHNPDWDAGGVVRAIDIDNNGIDVNAVLKALIGDQRVWYVIWDHHIYSRTYGWKKQVYNGTDPHTGHIHVSIQGTRAAENDTSTWLSANTNKPTPGDPEEWESIMALFNSKAEFEASVAKGTHDGIYQYFGEFFKNEQGTGDTILDEVRAQRTVDNKANSDLLAAVKENTAAVKANKPA